MAHGWAICLFLLFILEIQARSKNSYKCTINKKYGNSTNKCSVTEQRFWNYQRNTEIPKPTNCKIDFFLQECSIRVKVKFEYKGLQQDEIDLEGFGITILSPKRYYNVTLPADYNKAIGGNFTVNLKTFDIFNSLSRNQYYTFDVQAQPNSKTCHKRRKFTCVSEQEYKDSGCKKHIPICPVSETRKNGTPSSDIKSENITEVTPVTSSTETPTTMPDSLIIGLIVAFAFATIIVIVWICFSATAIARKCRWKPQKKRAVLLASSGDNTSQFTDLANQIASELQSSGQFEDVFFTGWLQVNELERNLEKLHDALHHATVVILFTSPFGRSSYEKFVEQGQLATWKDEFVIGAHSLFRKQRHHVITSRAKKILVVYYNDDADVRRKSDFLHADFVARANKSYDLTDPHDNSSLYRELLSSHHGNKYQTVAVDMKHFT